MMVTYFMGLGGIAGILLPDWEFFDREISKWTQPVCVDDINRSDVLRPGSSSQFLVMLKLAHCEIECLNTVQMGSLRKLSLTYVKVGNEMFEKIISGCPSLQELVMRHVHVLDELRITAPNIEKLDLEYFSRCVLDCPNLKILNIHLISSTESILQVVNIPSVCKVHIQSTFQIDEIVSKICTVEQSNFKELNIPQTMWKRLHIESQLNEDQFIGICRVLNSSPHLEELIVCSYSQQNLRQDLGKSRKTHEHHVLSEELSSPCVIPLLKSVTIHGHKVPCQGLLRLAEFLLKSCVNLEKMVILPSTYKLGAVEELKFVKQLLSFPKASANARVICGSEIY
uniref:FBD domain-containing protein n=1 Tax=Chenopodium quinoa TaxID=63459 RepID=A0A803N0P1_CHEQI